MAKALNNTAGGLDQVTLYSLNSPCQSLPTVRSQKGIPKKSGELRPPSDVLWADETSEWKLNQLDFALLEENSTIITIDYSPNKTSFYLHSCCKCGSRERISSCKRCRGDLFGVFRILGNAHGIFCKACSLSVDRWKCSSCGHSNTCTHTIKALVKRAHSPQNQVIDQDDDGTSFGFLNYLFALLILIILVHQIWIGN
jgi:hypothetical protein